MGISGHDGAEVFPRLFDSRLLQVGDERDQPLALFAEIEPDIQGHLIVTAPGGMQLGAGRADLFHQGFSIFM